MPVLRKGYDTDAIANRKAAARVQAAIGDIPLRAPLTPLSAFI